MKNIIVLITTFLVACISFLFNYYLCSIATQIILGFTVSYLVFQFILVFDNLLDKYEIVEEVKEVEKECVNIYHIDDKGVVYTNLTNKTVEEYQLKEVIVKLK